MSSSAPGTLFRAFNAEKTAHATAVLLKNGSILQVKNADGETVRAVYPSLEGWLAAVHADPARVVTDTAAAQGAVIGADTHGFNYFQAERRYQVPDHRRWTNWCYERMAEMTPQFLEREDVRAAYNALVAECCGLPDSCVHFSYVYDSKPKKYSPDNFQWLSYADAGGIPIQYSYWGGSSAKDKFAAAAARIKAAYKTFYDLVGEELRRKLKIYHDMTAAEHQLKYYAQRARRLQKKMEALAVSVTETTAKLEEYKKKMDDLKATL